MKKLILALLMICGFLAAPVFSVFADVATNEPAPDFTLQDTNGKPQKLSGYKGKFVVLEWVNHDCPFVKKHYDSGNMQKLQEEYTKKDVVWLSINSSAEGKEGHISPEEWNRLTEEKKAKPIAVLLDPDGAVGKTYGAKTTPHMFVINPDGVLIYQGAIDSIASVDQGDVIKAQNYVKDVLDQAVLGQSIAVSDTKSYGCSVKY